MEEIGLKELFDYFIAKIEILFLILTCVLVIGNVYSLFIKTPLYKSEVKLVLVSENNTQAGITQGDVQLNNNLVDTLTIKDNQTKEENAKIIEESQRLLQIQN